MMENRSFDHMLGWLPGADGKQAGLTYEDSNGQSHATWPLAPDYTGCNYQDPLHLWQAVATQYDNGKCDGWLKTQPVGDQYPIGYYTATDLPVLAALAQNYTAYDQYFCSMLGPTWPNRLYQLCATTDLDYTGFYPAPGQPRPVKLQTAIFDRLQAAGLTGGYYTFGEPMTGLFASMKYDSITYPFSKFLDDASAGKLPNVAFVDPDYTAVAEATGTSNDDHPYGDVRAGEAFMAQVHNVLKASPQWERMVFIINFDEHGGFYDHVAPPPAQDDTVLAQPGPDLKRLGFRVPAIAMGPYAPKKIDHTGPYEHCSILNMIEWRWGLEPMTIRDKTARNLALSLDFANPRPAFDLPPYAAPTVTPCTNDKHLP
jgi:phospholipase C